MYRVPDDIDYGILKGFEYLPEYGRFEAQVSLHFVGGAQARPPVTILASVAARPGEHFDDIRLRLVLKAARLLRLVEVEEAVQDDVFSDPPLAA